MGLSARGEAGGGKQQLAELKALQTSLKDQLAAALKGYDPASRAAAAEARRSLAQVNAAIAKMAGLDTMSTAPGAGSPGGTSLKYNPATGKIE
jgi:septal ring factor EnvC (AmiA/AmiB activator)